MTTLNEGVRRPICAAVFPTSDSMEGWLTVVCDDGSVWYQVGGRGEWLRDFPIPGTRAALAAADSAGGGE